MIYQEYHDNPERYLFRYVLSDFVEDYIAQGWEIIGPMQNQLFAFNSVTSYVMAFYFE
jgi:hypothetical protein